MSAPSQTNEPYVGSRIKKLKGELFVAGRAPFVADFSPPGTLHMAVVRSPHAHARICGIDSSAAEKAPGVARVLSGEEACRHLNPIPYFMDPRQLGGKRTDILALAADKVLYAGQPVAAVVAASRQDAQAAAALVRVHYEPLPVVLDAEAAVAPGAPMLFEQWGDNVMVCHRFTAGDVELAFRTADHVIRDSLRIQRYSTQPIETRAYLAVFDKVDESLTLYATAQNPHPLRNVLSEALRIPENRIRIIVPNLGGAFGLKMHGHPEEPLVCLLAKLTGRPVKWMEGRDECLLIGGREQIHHFEVAFNKDGRIAGLKDDFLGNVGVPTATPGWAMVFLTALTMPSAYRIENIDVQFSAVVTNKGPWNASRGYGKEATHVVMERIMDLVAIHLGMDPAEVRFRNFIPANAFPYQTPTGLVVDSGDYETTLKKTLNLIGYRQLREEQQRSRQQGRYLGIGIGYELTPEGGSMSGTLIAGYDTSTVKVDPAGKVTVLTGVTNPGGGSDTGIAQIVADELGVDLSEIRVLQGDTDSCPYGFGNFSGRSLMLGGASAALAARAVREKIAKVAGVLLGEDWKELVFHRGSIHPKDRPGVSVSVQEVAYTIYTRPYDVASVVEPSLEETRTYKPTHVRHIPDEHGHVNPYPSYSNGAYIAVVEVDVETGRVRVIRVAAIHDCGVVVNPLLVEGQTHGAVAMGIGAALGEEVAYNNDGSPLTTSLKDYLMPRAADIPLIEIGHHCTPSPFTLLGTKGAGEAGIGGTVAAVVNAVADALAPFGVEIRELPLNPPRIWRLMRGRVLQNLEPEI
ncbi:MAG TPA: xanthine dehydrogenase family protein molybdopterin-binding subunit [Candidatus Dormibacteraeota bacterium]|nr:xanthine dehydrogenase family protein molybdopterin-binding subunit [Candidatus Dormibacteraeota bacterium]